MSRVKLCLNQNIQERLTITPSMITNTPPSQPSSLNLFRAFDSILPRFRRIWVHMTAKSRMEGETRAVCVNIMSHGDVVDFSHCQRIKIIRHAHALTSPNMSVFILEPPNTDIFLSYKTRYATILWRPVFRKNLLISNEDEIHLCK